MRNVEEMLRDADPLRHEPPRTNEDRNTLRRVILERASHTPAAGARFSYVHAPVALVAVILTLMVLGSRGWWSGTTSVLAAVRFEVRLAEETPTLGLRQVRIPATGRTIYLHSEPVLTNADIAQARVVEGDGQSGPGIGITFNDGGAAKILRATQGHTGRPVAVLIDGEVVMAPVVKSPMSTAAIITGDFTRREVERIVTGIVGR